VESSGNAGIPLLGTAYFPPIEYFHVLACFPAVAVDACESYQKQSWRNRCTIYSAGGVQALQIPVCHDNIRSGSVRDIRIDYSREWLHQHRIAIISAYRSSPFFEYYWDGIDAILQSRPEKLFDLNTALTRHIAAEMELRCEILTTDSFVKDAGQLDFRSRIHPKSKENPVFETKPYYQIFSGKSGFISNLSILDLLFHEGPQAADFLKA
jgi:hypothetical protein